MTPFSEEHDAFRHQLRRFVQQELAPHVDAWERDGGFPREVFLRMGGHGLLGAGIPEAYGGAGGDLLHQLVVAEELTASGSPGLAASLGSLAIAVPPILHAGTEAQKQRWIPAVVAGKHIAALCVTEPGGGSDVANLRTRATRHPGGGWVLNGQKTFITSGTRADVLTVAARTGGDGASGVSVFVVEAPREGLTQGPNLDKLGWHASDTAEVFFDDVHVPDDAMIGPENAGFVVLMQNFATERLMLAVTCVTMAQLAFDEARRYAAEREAFGKALTGFQVTRHRLADMATDIAGARAHVYSVAARAAAGEPVIAEVAMAKNHATDVCSRVCDAALQLWGGAGYMRGALVERLYRDARLYPIGGGTREIMNEIIAKALL